MKRGICVAEYVVKRLEGCLPDIRGKDFDPDRDMAGAEYAAIALYAESLIDDAPLSRS